MPLLPLEPFVFPATLFSDVPPETDGGRWWALHTRPRAEKGLARRFLRRGLAFFLPLYKRQWRSNGRLLVCYREEGHDVVVCSLDGPPHLLVE